MFHRIIKCWKWWHWNTYLISTTHSVFRSLRCVRNKIHTNLFISLIFNNLSWISWYIFLWYDWKQFLDENKDWPVQKIMIAVRLIFLKVVIIEIYIFGDWQLRICLIIILGSISCRMQNTTFFSWVFYGYNVYVDALWRYDQIYKLTIYKYQSIFGWYYN